MRDLKNKLTPGKNTKNITRRKSKSFGYQVLGFGSGAPKVPLFTSATGGAISTCGDYKIHTFTGGGCFVVTAGNGPTVTGGGPNKVDYLVVAGGGSGGGDRGGGGGAGGVRSSFPNACGHLVITTGTFPITVGSGGAGVGDNSVGTKGGDSVFSNITATGGGRGGSSPSASSPGGAGGSGGGGSGPGGNAGPGNNPPTSDPATPSQGNNGGSNPAPLPGLQQGGGGGGGSGNAGGNGGPGNGGNGGNGTQFPTGIAIPSLGESRTFAGGGGGGRDGRTGGSGAVVIRYKFQ